MTLDEKGRCCGRKPLCGRPRPDRYKSYRPQRRFKATMQAEEKEYQASINERLIYFDEDGMHIGLSENPMAEFEE